MKAKLNAKIEVTELKSIDKEKLGHCVELPNAKVFIFLSSESWQAMKAAGLERNGEYEDWHKVEMAEVWQPAINEVLKKAGLDGTAARWSYKCGCSCGCSPGWNIDFKSDYDLYADVNVTFPAKGA